MPGTPELIVIFVVVLLLFGPDKLPELARNIGRGVREVRRITADLQKSFKIDE
jgi:TatA/E family protein of Tat protein translocase